MQNRDEYSLPFTCQLHVTNASICNCFLPPNSIPLWLGAPVYSFSAVYSFSSLQFLIFLCLSSVRNFLFSYCGPKLHLPIILHKVTDNSRALRRLSLKIDLLSWVLVSPGQSVRGPRLPIPWTLWSLLLKFRIFVLLHAILFSFNILNSTILWSLQSNLLSTSTNPASSSLFMSSRSIGHLLYYAHLVSVMKCLPKFPHLLGPCNVAFPGNIRGVWTAPSCNHEFMYFCWVTLLLEL